MKTEWALALIVVYFIPTLVCVCRGKRHGGWSILLTNLLLGWTVIGWFTALIWASSGKTNAEARDEERRHQEMVAAMKDKRP